MLNPLSSPTAANPNRLREILREFALSPLKSESWRAAGAILLGFVVGGGALALFGACLSTGGSLVIVLIGFPILGLGVEICRFTARLERRRMAMADPRPLRPHPYRPYGPSLRGKAEAVFMDENRWRDVVYVLVGGPLAILESVLTALLWVGAFALLIGPVVFIPLGRATVGSDVVFVIGLLLLPVAASTPRGLLKLHRGLVDGLLCISEESELRFRVDTLRESRSAVLKVEANELRRIERDLHDGVQQRLVSLAIDLGLASDRVDSDPAGARALLLEAREQANEALAELRDLVRGAAPAILLDRGLVAALGSVAGRCPIPTIVKATLPAGFRQPDAVERAAYFVAAEALTNVAKHSSATRCEVRCRQERDLLVVEVWDDGRGGAEALPAGGLAGLRDRVEALDGQLRIESPSGGPTLVHADMPI
jgi:signal transduction histidine kinase